MFEKRFKTFWNGNVTRQSAVDVSETDTEGTVYINSNVLEKYNESDAPTFDENFDLINVPSTPVDSAFISEATNKSKNRTEIKSIQVQFCF